MTTINSASSPCGGSLRLLYRRYADYLRALSRDAGHNYAVRNFDEFVAWWNRLSPTVRQKLEDNYRQGYHAVIAQGRREILELLGVG